MHTNLQTIFSQHNKSCAPRGFVKNLNWFDQLYNWWLWNESMYKIPLECYGERSILLSNNIKYKTGELRQLVFCELVNKLVY